MLNIKRYLGAIVFAIFIHISFYYSSIIKELDYKFYDLTQFFLSSTKDESSSYTVIIDIDEKSLHALGQWPWPRVIDAKLINSIKNMNPSAIGINILFPEKDRTSPLVMKKFYKNFFNLNIRLDDFPLELQDNDKLLSESIKKSNATLSTYFQNSPYTKKHCQELLYRDNVFKGVNINSKNSSLLCNYNMLQKSVDNFGFINASSDKDGVFRRIPLFVNYKNRIFPSFALATILSFDRYIDIDSKKSSILVNFSTKPKIFSAIDILRGEVSASDIQGKIVILGSSIVGINSNYLTSTGKKVSSSVIHASVIDNILDNSFLVENEVYKIINIIISFILSIVITILIFKQLYLYVIALFISTIIVSFYYIFNSYLAGIYISIIYLWTPFLLFFIILLFYHIKFIDKKREEQEKFLIRQSKLASMGEMISLIAHQWRQPLSQINGIVLNIDIDLRKHNIYIKNIDRHLNDIEDTTKYLSKTINDFLDFFIQNKIKEKFYISEIITQSKTLLPIPNNIKIIYTNKKDISIIGYKSELIQSILVVLNNAIYATQKNLEKREIGEIVIDSYIKNNYLYILIEDSGKGIDKKDIKNIFNPYFTTKNKQHGTGLGLYILKLIVENSMNGKVIVENGKRGAIFTIKIPQNID